MAKALIHQTAPPLRGNDPNETNGERAIKWGMLGASEMVNPATADLVMNNGDSWPSVFHQCIIKHALILMTLETLEELEPQKPLLKKGNV